MTFGRKKKTGSPYGGQTVCGGYGDVSRLRYETNVSILLDVSSSMPDEGIRYMMEHGFKSIMQTLIGYMGLDYHYHIRIATFGSEVREVLPFTPVEEAIDLKLPAVQTGGVTCTEDGMRDAIQATRQQKQEQDDAHLKRGSSLCIVITDGIPTDGEGRRTSLDPDLVDEIALLNASRTLITFAVGFGNVDERVLSQLAPADHAKLRDGSTMPFAHALRFTGDYDEKGRDFWQVITKLVGSASSSTTTAGHSDQMVVGFAYEDADLPEAFRNVSLVDPSLDVQLLY